MQPTCHIYLIHLVKDFCPLGFPTWGLGKRWHPVMRCVLGYRPAPCGTVMQPTCHMFLIHLVEDFCGVGFQTWGLGPRCHPLGGGCRDGSWAIDPPLGDSDATNMSHIPHPPSGRFLRPWFPHRGPGPKMPPPIGGTEIGLGLYARPLGDSDVTIMSYVTQPPSGRFLRDWFPHLVPRPKMAHP